MVQSKKVNAQEKIQLTPELANNLFQSEKKRYEAIMKERKKVENYLLTTEKTISALKELKDKSDNEILVNLGSGVFVEAKLNETKKVKSNIGSDIFIEVDLEEKQKDLIKRKEKFVKDLQELQKLEVNSQNNLNQLYGYLMNIQKQQQAKQQ